MDDTRTTPMEEALADLRQSINEPDAYIRVEAPDWTKLMRKGVIINLHIRRWRARAKLDFADLGLYDTGNDKELDDLINLGEKLLLPPALIRKLDSIETSARANLEKRAFTTYWGLFMPEGAYPAWKEENEYWKAAYYQVRDQIREDYDQNLEILLLNYRKAAQLAYQRIKALTPGRMTTAERLDEQVFANRFVGKLRELIPSKGKIYASFDYQEELTYIPLLSLLAEDKAAADLAYEKAQTARAEEYAKRNALSEQERAQSMMVRDLQDRAAEKKTELIDGFIYDILGQLRGLVYEASTEVLSSIKRNGNLQPRSVVQLRNLIDQLNSLNFYGDREIDKMIARLQAITNQSADTRKADLGNIEQSLRDIATITRGTLLDIGEQPRTPKGQSLVGLGIMSKPPADLIRQARHNLDINPSDAAPKIERKGGRKA